MSLKKIYSLTEAPLAAGSQDNTEPNPEYAKTGQVAAGSGGQLKKVFGQGPMSNGVPVTLPMGGKQGPAQGPEGTVAVPGTPVDQGETQPIQGMASQDQQTIPNPRPNVGGTGQPPQGGSAFSRAPNAPDEEPLPDLPLEGVSIAKVFGLRQEFSVPRRGGKLMELYNLDEMPRPAGTYAPPVMAALKWAKERGGQEFTARDMFWVWRKAGGQPNQPDDNKAYYSFQTSLRQFIDQRGRGTPEQPLVVVQAGRRGGHGSAAIYSWGAVRPSKTAAAKPMPGRTPFDDMELGPAGSMDQEPEGAPEPGPEQGQEPEPEHGQEEPSAEPEEPEQQQSDEDEFDWIPEPNEETGVGRSMIYLQENDPEKLQEMLVEIHGLLEKRGTVFDAAKIAMRIFGKPGSATGSHAMKVAKSAAANLGLEDPDGLL